MGIVNKFKSHTFILIKYAIPFIHKLVTVAFTYNSKQCF